MDGFGTKGQESFDATNRKILEEANNLVPLSPLSQTAIDFGRNFVKRNSVFFIQTDKGGRIFPETYETIPDEQFPLYLKLQEKENIILSIKYVNTFDELYSKLTKIQSIKDGNEVVTSENLVKSIENARTGVESLDVVPESLSLRNIVNLLIMKEALSQKADEGGSEILYPIKEFQFRAFMSHSPLYGEVGYVYDSGKYDHASLPAIGAFGLRTRLGVINGPLVWCDGITAIFKTPEGYLRVNFYDLQSPDGKTYREIEEDDKKKKDQDWNNRTVLRSRQL